MDFALPFGKVQETPQKETSRFTPARLMRCHRWIADPPPRVDDVKTYCSLYGLNCAARFRS